MGDGAGHFWGNVQAIKTPTLLEIWGPLFMSYPAVSNLQYRLSEENGVTRLKFVHRAMGSIAHDPETVEGGGDSMLDEDSICCVEAWRQTLNGTTKEEDMEKTMESGMKMKTPPVVSAEEWEAARQKLLVKEKEVTHARDAMAAERRRMPWHGG